jgi:hypothetical protein
MVCSVFQSLLTQGIPQQFTKVKVQGIPTWGISSWGIPQQFTKIKVQILVNMPEFLCYAYIS